MHQTTCAHCAKRPTAVSHHTLHIALYNYTGVFCVTATILSVGSALSSADTHEREPGTTSAHTLALCCPASLPFHTQFPHHKNIICVGRPSHTISRFLNVFRLSIASTVINIHPVNILFCKIEHNRSFFSPPFFVEYNFER